MSRSQIHNEPPQGQRQHLVLRHRGLSGGRSRQIRHRLSQPHQDSARSRIGEIYSVLRQSFLENIIFIFIF